MTAADEARLRSWADPDCAICDGDGYVTYTAHNCDGYTEVACDCSAPDEEPHDPREVA